MSASLHEINVMPLNILRLQQQEVHDATDAPLIVCTSLGWLEVNLALGEEFLVLPFYETAAGFLLMFHGSRILHFSRRMLPKALLVINSVSWAICI